MSDMTLSISFPTDVIRMKVGLGVSGRTLGVGSLLKELSMLLVRLFDSALGDAWSELLDCLRGDGGLNSDLIMEVTGANTEFFGPKASKPDCILLIVAFSCLFFMKARFL